MDAYESKTSPDELVSEVGGLMTGLGVLSFTFFPFALPALALTLVLVLPVLVLALPALAVWLLARAVLRGGRRVLGVEHRRERLAGERDGIQIVHVGH
jgi:hypothetical protein